MSKKLLLYIAGFLTLFTFLGHTAGQFMPIPPEQGERVLIYETMQRPVVTFPFGAPKSFAQCLTGANLSVSVFLLMTGLSFLLLARSKEPQRGLLLLNSLGVAAVGILSIFFFSPLPAVCLLLAGVCGGLSLMKNFG